MNIGLIFDLDLTLIDSSVSEQHRKNRDWQKVYPLIPSYKEYPGITEALNFITENKMSFGIVTKSQGAYCQRVCQHWQIKPAFQVAWHDVPRGYHKPHPKHIQIAIERLAIKPHQILSFGDTSDDITASNQAGANSVACLWGSADKDNLIEAKPTYILKRPAEIIPLIKEFKESIA